MADADHEASSGAPRSVRAGAHAGAPRRRWMIPVAALTLVVVLVATWQAFQLTRQGTTPPATSGTEPSSSGASPVGVHTQVSIGDAGAMQVVETLTFDVRRTSIELSVPRRVGVGADFSPTVGSLVLREPSIDQAVGPIVVGEIVSVELGSPSARVVLQYDATGVVVRSGDASSPQRALALVTPLVVAQARGLPRTVEVRSVKVLNVGCLREDVLAGCGTKTSDGWTVETSGAEDGALADVVAQLDLPAP